MSKKHKHEEQKPENITEQAATENEQKIAQNENVDTVVSQEEQTDEQNPAPDVKPQSDPIAEINAQLAEMKDKYLRLSAEFDNYRKRTFKEKAELLKYAAEDMLKDLLPVIDDMDRALKAIDTANDLGSVKEGISLIVSKFNDFLKAKGVKEIDAIGKELDTDLHEAITKIPVQNDEQKGKIVDVIQKGYLLHDKVMRFSKVVVGE